ncbi:MAG: protein-glutamate O-methyltransferase CheR [Acidobacteriota bacterium]|jgi:chemotaxis protein methyltransferase CheR|nr:protein-glutamate O-methyltransferase CheR [Acidobacteriota bacterium]
MNTGEYKAITNYVFNTCGIVLGEDKQYLVQQRLTPVLPDLGCKDLTDLAKRLSGGVTSFVTREKIVNAMTTNETSFFRDGHPFVAFRDKMLPDLFKRVRERKARSYQRRGPKVSIWCAAVSTGQEAYSLGMLIADAVKLKGMGTVLLEDFGILGTDISSRVLSKALEAKYTVLDVARGLPPEMRDRYFERDGDSFHVRKEICGMMEFKALNIQEPFSQLGGFDVILCRNILIYFNDDAKRKILAQFFQILAPGGYLMLGSAENLYGLNKDFVTERYGATVMYRKP